MALVSLLCGVGVGGGDGDVGIIRIGVFSVGMVALVSFLLRGVGSDGSYSLHVGVGVGVGVDVDMVGV